MTAYVANLKIYRLNLFCSEVKEIRSLYFDSTFCSEATDRIPSRRDSAQELIRLTRDWLKQDTATNQRWPRRLLIYCAAKYGHELLLAKLSKQLQLPVHVSREKFRFYLGVKRLRDYFTEDPFASPVHACDYWVRCQFLCCLQKKVFTSRGEKPHVLGSRGGDE